MSRSENEDENDRENEYYTWVWEKMHVERFVMQRIKMKMVFVFVGFIILRLAWSSIVSWLFLSFQMLKMLVTLVSNITD